MTNFPEEQCKKKLKLYHLYKELEELSGDIIVPSLLNHFQRESAEFHKIENFSDEFWADKKKRSKYFMYKNTIDALMWLYVKEEDTPDNEHDPIGKGFEFTTSQIVKLLKIPQDDLFGLRKIKELEENVHYIREDRNSKAAAKYAPIFYNIELTCLRSWGISYKDFCKPDFDLEEHKKKRTEEYYKNKKTPWIPRRQTISDSWN